MTVLVQVEFEDCLYDAVYSDKYPANFCAPVSQALNATVKCNTLIPVPQDRVLLAGIQFQVVGPVNVYGQTTNNVNTLLTVNGFFPQLFSGNPRVTSVSLYYRPTDVVIGLGVLMFLILLLLGVLEWYSTFPGQANVHPQRHSRRSKSAAAGGFGMSLR